MMYKHTFALNKEVCGSKNQPLPCNDSYSDKLLAWTEMLATVSGFFCLIENICRASLPVLDKQMLYQEPTTFIPIYL